MRATVFKEVDPGCILCGNGQVGTSLWAVEPIIYGSFREVGGMCFGLLSFFPG